MQPDGQRVDRAAEILQRPLRSLLRFNPESCLTRTTQDSQEPVEEERLKKLKFVFEVSGRKMSLAPILSSK